MGPPARDPVVKAGDIVEGRYRIISDLGEGGMGTVFLAEHAMIKRRVAIKILHPELATDSDVVERFMNEARAAGTLGHPNIVESTDMGFTHNHVPYIVFEYLEGSLLTDEIYRVGGMPVRRAIRIAQQIASALVAAHNAGIIHRDLKSDNVFLTDRDESSDHVKVLDFGISRFLHVAEGSGGAVMGTPEFMAPEQITAPDSVDHRADIYALGVMLYEMLAARRPFTADEADPRALMARILSEPPPSIDQPEVPLALRELIIGKLLAKSPDDRYQTMTDVEVALDGFIAPGQGAPQRRSRPIETVATDAAGVVTARKITPAAPRAITSPPHPSAPLERRTWVPYAVAAAGLLVGVIGIVVGLGGRADPRTVAVTLESSPAGASVSFRRRIVITPATVQLPASPIVERVEVSAPGHKTMRYWITFDRPTRLVATLPAGEGVVEASDDENMVAADAKPSP